MASPCTQSKGYPRCPSPPVRHLHQHHTWPRLSSKLPNSPPTFSIPTAITQVRVTIISQFPFCLMVYLTVHASLKKSKWSLVSLLSPFPVKVKPTPALRPRPPCPCCPLTFPDLFALFSLLNVTMFCFAPKVFSRPLFSAKPFPVSAPFPGQLRFFLPVLILKRQFFRNQPECPSPQRIQVRPQRTLHFFKTLVMFVIFCLLQVPRPISTKA